MSAPSVCDKFIILLTFSFLLFFKKYLIILALFEEPPPRPAETGIFFSIVILKLSFVSLYFLQKLRVFNIKLFPSLKLIIFLKGPITFTKSFVSFSIK